MNKKSLDYRDNDKLVPPDPGSLRKPGKHAIHFNDPSLAKQEFRDECVINEIMKKYQAHGVNPYVVEDPRFFVDVSDPVDYQEALNIVARSQTAFESIPAKLRDQLGNDPARFLQWVKDPANAEEMYKLGLAIRQPEPIEDRIINAFSTLNSEPDSTQSEPPPPAKGSKKNSQREP